MCEFGTVVLELQSFYFTILVTAGIIHKCCAGGGVVASGDVSVLR